MLDYMVRIISETENVRALASVTTGLVDEARRRHGTWPAASAALGRALTGGALLGMLLKTGQRLALKFEGNGPLRKIVVEAESNGAVRGYVAEPQVHMVNDEGKLDVAGALGRTGFLTVTKDLGLKEPYRGMVQLYTGEIAEDLAFYLTESEQVPSAVGLGVFVETDNSVSAAGGFLIQTMPPSDEKVIDRLMEQIGRLPPITMLLREGKTPEQLLELLFTDVPYLTLEKRMLAFRCTCSREKVEEALISLGREELADLIAREDETEITCDFCRESYLFSRDELERLLGEMHGNGL
ncbi:MAG TPA: Hsp33 family molecular chaperone HslO [Geobacteraceae bacterium]|nr:Hsp33 family molecular chaperone HslO [Geobacteraceae bacterium]